MKRSFSRRGFLICLGIGGTAMLLLMATRGAFTAESPRRFWHILCDAAFVPGAILFGIGILVFVAGDGFFDMISYGVLKVVSLWYRKEKRDELPKTFFDYREMKDARRRGGTGYLTLSGLVFIAAALVFLAFYSSAS